MNKSKKIMLRVLPIFLFAIVILAGNVFATETTSNGISAEWPEKGDGIATIDTTVSNVWSTVLTIFQVLAITAIVFAGIRYMFASADAKADIKKSMVILVLGAALVFGASTVAQFVMNATESVLTNS